MNTVNDDPPEGYRIDELARLAGSTVRNIRAYQDRGILPPPRREGRVGLYSDAHLARLRLIGQLLGRGYSVANIAELLGAWEGGQDLGALLGLEAALTEPWSEETSVTVTAGELGELFGVRGAAAQGLLREALAEGFIRPEGASYAVDNPRLLAVGAELAAAGVSISAVLGHHRRLRVELDAVAAGFVDLVATHVFEPLGEPIPAADVPRAAELVRRLRPLAERAVVAELADAMDRQVQERLSDWMARLLEQLGPARSSDAVGA